MPTQTAYLPLPPSVTTPSRTTRAGGRNASAPASRVGDPPEWAALDLITDLVCITTVDGTLRFLNRAARDLLALVDEASLTGSLFPMHTFAARELMLDEVVPAAIAHGRTTSDTALQSSDGRVFPASQTVLHTPAADGAEATLTIVIRNLNLERLTAARLGDSHRLYETIARHSPDLTFLYDPNDGRVLWTNRCPHSFLGAPERDARMLSHKELRRLIHPDDREALAATAERMAGAYGENDSLRCEVRMRSGGGMWHWVLIRASVFSRRESGAPSLLLGITTEITARKQVEQRLAQSRDDAERAVENAHTILDALSKDVRAIADRFSVVPVTRIATLVDDMQELAADIATLATDGSDVRAAIEPVDLTTLLASVVATERRVAPHEISLPGTPVIVSTDPERLALLITRVIRSCRGADAPSDVLQISLRAPTPGARFASIDIAGIPVAVLVTDDSTAWRALQVSFAALGCDIQHIGTAPDSTELWIHVPIPSRAAALAGSHPLPAPLA
jgi:PAS domain S-box-containing protein